MKRSAVDQLHQNMNSIQSRAIQLTTCYKNTKKLCKRIRSQLAHFLSVHSTSGTSISTQIALHMIELMVM